MTVFADWRRRDKVAEGLRDDLAAWLREYLAQYERDFELPPRSIPMPQHMVVRHGGWLHPSEYSGGPAVVVWVAGVQNIGSDPTDSVVFGDLEIGVKLVVAGTRWNATEWLGHYQAVVTQLLADRTTCGGLATDLVPVDEDYTDFESQDEAQRVGVTLTYEAVRVELSTRHAGPPADADPRPDPYDEPWPDAEVAESTVLAVDELSIIDPED